jgi:hypothetical protein
MRIPSSIVFARIVGALQNKRTISFGELPNSMDYYKETEEKIENI